MKFELRLMDDFADVTTWTWYAKDKTHGIVARAPDDYNTEQEARSAIAKARKSFAGAKFAKVEVTSYRDDPFDAEDCIV